MHEGTIYTMSSKHPVDATKLPSITVRSHCMSAVISSTPRGKCAICKNLIVWTIQKQTLQKKVLNFACN